MVADAILVDAPSRRTPIDAISVDEDANWVGIDAYLMVADAILVDDPSRRTPIGTISVDRDTN